MSQFIPPMREPKIHETKWPWSAAGWQQCPVCAGRGSITAGSPLTKRGVRDQQCPTCGGKRIISTSTGRPPT